MLNGAHQLTPSNRVQAPDGFQLSTFSLILPIKRTVGVTDVSRGEKEPRAGDMATWKPNTSTCWCPCFNFVTSWANVVRLIRCWDSSLQQHCSPTWTMRRLLLHRSVWLKTYSSTATEHSCSVSLDSKRSSPSWTKREHWYWFNLSVQGYKITWWANSLSIMLPEVFSVTYYCKDTGGGCSYVNIDVNNTVIIWLFHLSYYI